MTCIEEIASDSTQQFFLWEIPNIYTTCMPLLLRKYPDIRTWRPMFTAVVDISSRASVTQSTLTKASKLYPRKITRSTATDMFINYIIKLLLYFLIEWGFGVLG